MDSLRDVVLFILLRHVYGTSYYISETATNWTTASGNCKLAVPELYSPTKQITVLQDADIDEVWVGYYRARTAFEYFGCTQKDNNMQKINVKDEDPGQCFSVCGTKNVIGIFEKECFCLDTETIDGIYQNTMAPVCNKSCDTLRGVACGGTAKSTDDVVNTKSYMSLYRSIDNDIDVKGEASKCVLYDHQGFHLKKCHWPHAFICGKGNSVWVQNSNGQSIIRSRIEATQICFANNTRPSTFNNTKNLREPLGTTKLWTGIVISNVIYKYSNDPSHVQLANKYGILKRTENDLYELKPVNTDNQKPRKSLCIKESERTTDRSSTTDTETAVPEKNTSVFSTTTTTTTTAAVTTTTTTRSSSETESTVQLRNKSDSSSAGAIVGATIAVVVVITVVIIVVFLRKRGVQLPFLKKEMSTQSPDISRNNVGDDVSKPVEAQQSNYTTSQNEYAEIDVKQMIDNGGENGVVNCVTETPEHDYFVLEKQEEGPYHSTKPELNKSDKNTFNPYNTLRLNEDSDYDHVRDNNMRGGISGRNASGSDGTYNTTSLRSANLKTSKNAPDNEYNMVDVTEDTYNHTNLPTSKNGLSVSGNDYDAI